MKFSSITIGIPKEIMQNENRVSATTDTINKLIEKGIKVVVKSKAWIMMRLSVVPIPI